MTTKERTLVFNLLVGLFNIVLGLAIEFVLIGGCLLFLARFPAIAGGISVNVILPFLLFAGIIIAMIISVRVVSWAVKKFKLQGRVDQKAIQRYIRED